MLFLSYENSILTGNSNACIAMTGLINYWVLRRPKPLIFLKFYLFNTNVLSLSLAAPSFQITTSFGPTTAGCIYSCEYLYITNYEYKCEFLKNLVILYLCRPLTLSDCRSACARIERLT